MGPLKGEPETKSTKLLAIFAFWQAGHQIKSIVGGQKWGGSGMIKQNPTTKKNPIDFTMVGGNGLGWNHGMEWSGMDFSGV